ncbi:MAG: TonB-dependent receptor [Candidatus Rokubacteria bacterium]|nr:TonB-dependent receptor [Candidatus Rokubacteria bacterium]
MRPILLMSFIVAMTAATAGAQPPPTLPPVVVESPRLVPERRQTDEQTREELERVPGSVNVIPQHEIESARSANLKDALDYTPGVLIRPRAGAADESQLSIRGSGLRNNFHLRGVNVLLDGFVYGQADGFSDFESLELLATKRIEVYKGANALRFGGFTLGGAVNLVTKTGHDEGLLALRSEAGSFGFWKNHLATGQVYGPFDLYGSFTDVELNGYRDYSDQIRHRFYTSFGYELGGGTSVRLDLGYVRNDENLPGALTRDELERDPRRADPTSVATRAARRYDYVRGALTVRTPLGESGAIEGRLQTDYQDLDHPLSFAIIDQTTYNWGAELRYIQTAPLFGLASRFTAGLQYLSTSQIDAQLANLAGRRGAKIKNQLNQATNVGLYAEAQLDVTSALTLVAGVRGQYAYRAVRDRFLSNGNQSGDVEYVALVPRFGTIGRVSKEVQVYGNASHAYEPPLLLELTAPGQLNTRNLSLLDAQKAWQFEVGMRGRALGRVTWDVAVYDIELWDEIQNVNVQPFPGAPFTVPRFRNIDRSRHMGLEAGFDVVIARDLIGGDSLTARTAYTWSRFVFVDDRNFGDNDVPGAPRHFLRGELRYDHASGFWVAPNVEFVPQGYVVNSENRNRTSPYELVSVRMGYDVKRWNLSVFFEGRNLADVTYASSVVVDSAVGRFYEPGDGRAFYGGVAWRWK